MTAGTNTIKRWGHKAQEKAQKYTSANDRGYLSIPVECNEWSIGVSNGKYGRFAKFGATCFSVNDYGFAYCKADSDKATAFVKMVEDILRAMDEKMHEKDYIPSAEEDAEFDEIIRKAVENRGKDDNAPSFAQMYCEEMGE